MVDSIFVEGQNKTFVNHSKRMNKNDYFSKKLGGNSFCFPVSARKNQLVNLPTIEPFKIYSAKGSKQYDVQKKDEGTLTLLDDNV